MSEAEKILEKVSLDLSIETGKHFYHYLCVTDRKVIDAVLSAMQKVAYVAYNSGSGETLESISKSMLSEDNLSKVQKESDKQVLRAVGETIKDFPTDNGESFIKFMFSVK